MGRERGVSLHVDRMMSDDDAGRLGLQVVVALPVPGRADWPWTKTAAAGRAHVRENLLHTSRAKRALEAADARLGRLRGQGLIAVFTRWAKFKHRNTFVGITTILWRPAPLGWPASDVFAREAHPKDEREDEQPAALRDDVDRKDWYEDRNTYS